jgi:hypothetical protein
MDSFPDGTALSKSLNGVWGLMVNSQKEYQVCLPIQFRLHG